MTCEEKLELLEKRLEKQEAINKVQLLLGNYYMTHVMNLSEPVNHFNQWCFWAERDDSSLEVADFGLFMGFNNVRAFFESVRPPEGAKLPTGVMFEHNLTTPMIVVAEDGETARGVWTCPGHETFGDHAEWAWGRVAVDFIKEKGEWKIWHYHWYRLFRSDFETPWTKSVQADVSKKMQRDKEIYRKFGGDPDRILPTTYFHPYTPDSYCEVYPKPPQPYETWTEDMLPI